MLFRHIAIEGPPGVGKTQLAERLGARLDATVVLDDRDNPFLAEFYQGRPGAAFQAQLFFTLARYRQQGSLRQSDLFSQLLISNYLFDRDKIYAYVNLDDNELFIYQRLYELIAPDVPPPDLVIYLQTPVEVVRRRLRQRAKADPTLPLPAADYIRELNEASTISSSTTRPARSYGRDVPRRSVMERRHRRRYRTTDSVDGKGHAVLRPSNRSNRSRTMIHARDDSSGARRGDARASVAAGAARRRLACGARGVRVRQRSGRGASRADRSARAEDGLDAPAGGSADSQAARAAAAAAGRTGERAASGAAAAAARVGAGSDEAGRRQRCRACAGAPRSRSAASG